MSDDLLMVIFGASRGSGGKREDESDIPESLAAIVDYVCDYAFSSAEVFTSYALAMGMSLHDLDLKTSPREEVMTLARKMGLAMDAGLTANLLVQTVEEKAMMEQAPEAFLLLIDLMRISEKEKGVLRSIVEKRRRGELEILDRRSGKLLSRVKIRSRNERGKPFSKDLFALSVGQFLVSFMERDVEIVFSPHRKS